VFSEEIYEMTSGAPYNVTGTVTANTEITSVKFFEMRGSTEILLNTALPNSTSYTFAQLVTPSGATVGLKVTATVQGGKEATETVPVIVRSIVMPSIALIPARYKVQSYVHNGVPDASRAGELWDITETHITEGCAGSAQTYTYNPGSHRLVFGGVTYEIDVFMQEQKPAYTFTATTGLVITLVMTEETCSDQP
jgi:hypothetical protein